MQAELTFRTLIALVLASLLITAALPAGAALPATTDDGPVMIDASHDGHDERCCLPELGGHVLCHVVAALPERDTTRTVSPVAGPIRQVRTPLVTRSLPPLQKPPIVAV